MPATRRIAPDYDGHTVPDSSDIQAQDLLRAKQQSTHVVPPRTKPNGRSAPSVAGSTRTRGGHI